MAKTSKKKKPQNKAIRALIRILSLILAVLLLVLAALLVIHIIQLDMLPMRYLIPITIIVVVVSLLLTLLTIFKAKRRWAVNTCFILLIIFCVSFYVGNNYVVRTNAMFDNITDLTDKVANNVSVYTMNTSGYTKLKDLNNLTVGYAPATDEYGTNLCLEEINNQGVSFNLQEYSDIVSMTSDLYNGNIAGMILNDSFLGTLHDIEDFTLITTMTTSLYSTVYYTDRDKSQQNEPDQVDVSSEPFTVLISGNDNYGSLSGNNRSDVNMLVTVNPKTGVVLMTSIPRDYYVDTVCESEDACLLGQKDKLTHTGLYGIGTTEQTLENLMGVTINYNVLVNFSSLVNMVDALGGIDVYVEEGLAVKQFYSNSTLEGVEEGWNHLDGERALAFARERHAYSTGDNQRVVNQQIVLSAIIKKVCSPSILLNYGNLVDAVGGAFQTNMPASDIQKLMKFELSEMPDWTFESYSLVGEGGYDFCAALGATAYVFYPYQETVDCARAKIEAVLDGKSSTTVESVLGDLNEGAYSIDTSEEIAEATGAYDSSDDEEYYEYDDYDYDDYDSEYDEYYDDYDYEEEW